MGKPSGEACCRVLRGKHSWTEKSPQEHPWERQSIPFFLNLEELLPSILGGRDHLKMQRGQLKWWTLEGSNDYSAHLRQ